MRQRGGYTNKILRNALAMVIKVLTLTSYGRKTLRNELCATLLWQAFCATFPCCPVLNHAAFSVSFHGCQNGRKMGNSVTLLQTIICEKYTLLDPCFFPWGGVCGMKWSEMPECYFNSLIRRLRKSTRSVWLCRPMRPVVRARPGCSLSTAGSLRARSRSASTMVLPLRITRTSRP